MESNAGSVRGGNRLRTGAGVLCAVAVAVGVLGVVVAIDRADWLAVVAGLCFAGFMLIAALQRLVWSDEPRRVAEAIGVALFLVWIVLFVATLF